MNGIQQLLDNHAKYRFSDRINPPDSYIEYIKKQRRFRRGLLEDLPRCGVVLHDSRSEEFLTRVGYSATDWTRLEIGTTDPNAVYHVYEKGDQPGFILNRGLPGCGGIATQAAELCALGVQNIVHIGTCGLVGDGVKGRQLVVSRGCYKDAGAIMLSPPDQGDMEVIAHSDSELSNLLIASATPMELMTPAHVFGYTIPIFYFQPRALIRDLITGNVYPDGPGISYFEMEGASLFATCRLMNARAGSVLVASDRYRLVDGNVVHTFENENDEIDVLAALQLTLAALRHKFCG